MSSGNSKKSVSLGVRKLIEYRAERELSRSALGKQLGVTVHAIGQYERGERSPDRYVVVRIKELTGGKITADDFMSE